MFTSLAVLMPAIAPVAPPADTILVAIRRGQPLYATAELRRSIAAAETLAVSVTGDGPVIVLLSGPIGSAYTWRQVTPSLASAGYQVVTIDPLGMGHSVRPRHADYILEARAGRVRAILDSLQISSAVIAAHGVSGSIAMRLALGFPGGSRPWFQSGAALRNEPAVRASGRRSPSHRFSSSSEGEESSGARSGTASARPRVIPGG